MYSIKVQGRHALASHQLFSTAWAVVGGDVRASKILGSRLTSLAKPQPLPACVCVCVWVRAIYSYHH